MIKVENNNYILENSFFRRCISADETGVRTTSIVNLETGAEYVKRKNVAEFKFSVNGKAVFSYHEPEYHVLDGEKTESKINFRYLGHESLSGQNGSEILKLILFLPEERLEISVFYEIYPDLPGCSKWLEFKCLEGQAHISKLFIEMFNACPGKFVDVEFFTNQGLDIKQAAFASCGDEDILQLHNEALREGMFVGNGAAGPLRYFMVYPNWASGIACGYNMSYVDFNKYLKTGETLKTERIFSMLYHGSQESQNARNRFREMIRRSLPEFADKGEVMYCTWLPFLKNINESLLLELAENAAKMGFKCFVVDDGWFVDGEWAEDKTKFPNGLLAISERVHELGMKFGLWFNVGTDYGNLESCPEDNALDFGGETKYLGMTADRACRCMASKHRDFLFEKLSELVKKYNVDYYKLDFSSIVSSYGVISSGCTSLGHEYHRDFSDSVFEQYEGMMHFRKKLKTEYPDLLIDFSFETFGTEKPSIGALRYSEVHHASNLNTCDPDIVDSRKIRNTLYQFCNLLPNERLLGSLICLQNQNDIEHLLTAFIGTPLVAGDLRKITPENQKNIAAVSAAMGELSRHAGLPNFCKLRGDKYIARNDWDGYARYSSKGHGFIGLFANDSRVEKTEICIPDYTKNIKLTCRDIITGKILGKFDSSEFNSGIAVDWLKNKSFIAVSIEPEKK